MDNHSLPHRQLRNGPIQALLNADDSLPHRQLRKGDDIVDAADNDSLPHRQLRKPPPTPWPPPP